MPVGWIPENTTRPFSLAVPVASERIVEVLKNRLVFHSTHFSARAPRNVEVPARAKARTAAMVGEAQVIIGVYSYTLLSTYTHIYCRDGRCSEHGFNIASAARR